MCGQSRHNTLPHAWLPPSYLGMDDLTTEWSFDLQATWDIDVFGLFFWQIRKTDTFKMLEYIPVPFSEENGNGYLLYLFLI